MNQRQLLDAIYVRDQSRSGMAERKWVVSQIVRLASEDMWTDSQIAAIVGYAPGSVRRQVSKAGVRKGRTSPEGGLLNASALDIMLALTGELTKEQRANLLTEAVKTGTSTKLISRVCGVRLGLVLYQQRKLKKEKQDGTGQVPGL